MIRKSKKYKKGDPVKVIAGKDKGKVGNIIEFDPTGEKAKVSGVNLKTKYHKPTQAAPGSKQKIEGYIHLSNLAYSTKDKEHIKVGYKLMNGSKKRINKKTGEPLGDNNE